MVTLADIRANSIGFGWYIRRCPDSALLAEFYGGILRLPVIRGRAPVWFYWVGEANVLELLSQVAPHPHRDTDPDTAACTPVFRCHDLAAYVGWLKARGVRIVRDTVHAEGRDVWLLDPDDQLVGLRERNRQSGVPGNAAAWARFDRGEDFNPGCSPMPRHIQELGWIVRHVSDLDAAIRLYRDVYGFAPLGHVGRAACFDLGNGVILELFPGGVSARRPTNREEVTDAWVQRVADHDLMNAWLKQNGVHLVNDKIQFPSAELTYAADADNHLTGFEERYDPSRFGEPRRPFLEDLEAERRWHATKSGR
ncbi:MAG: hypothetical protein SFV21_19955 [Rhodospirillaceae bacterium]|nr:hypothetical protein [Rhodospirillaceae bacterium]